LIAGYLRNRKRVACAFMVRPTLGR
jgi:hypothetical protein